MRIVLLIPFVILIVGCAHQSKSYVRYIRDAQKLEELCESRREEIALLKRLQPQMQAANTPAYLGDLARQRSEAASRARNAYSHDQRVRDLQDMARILERQIEALRAEIQAYGDGKHIDIFE